MSNSVRTLFTLPLIEGDGEGRHAKSFPDFDPAQGLPLSHCLLFAVHCPEGLCGTTGRIAAPAAPAFACERPYAFFAIDTRAPARRFAGGIRARAQPVSRPSPPRKQYSPAFRTRWIVRLAACPRVCRYCRRSPFVRTVARTCTWAVCPCCRRVCPIRFQES